MANRTDPLRILAENIRSAAEKAGGLKKLRGKTRLSNGTIYGLVGAKPRTPSLPTLRKLSRAGIEIPRELLLVG